MTTLPTSPGHLGVMSRGRFQVSYKATASFIVPKAAERRTLRSQGPFAPSYLVGLLVTYGRQGDRALGASGLWAGLSEVRSHCPGLWSSRGVVQMPSRKVDIRVRRRHVVLILVAYHPHLSICKGRDKTRHGTE